MESDYKIPISILKKRVAEIITELKIERTERLLSEKQILDNAIKWLGKVEKLNIDPNKQIVKLPETLTRTPSSEYRIVEDHESEEKQNWKEIKIDEKKIRPLPGSWLILN
ncbi:hypothetical protein D1815_02400 [Aquimarina sp. AD1]|uniref:hypothetical protein n=1 Tax=Aquimarina sp. (strain AD1) TaxID=1714848 RepID=UPI000E4C3A79|nr:hypothetical protein [Aquimarina sp. AD1]AXT54658.1 hypothetical protein D1815_02400 [Aquimarina sp. AD1]RKN21725.1 hypothetical protein D7035_12540 [Aquimarina sp. AD1]